MHIINAVSIYTHMAEYYMYYELKIVIQNKLSMSVYFCMDYFFAWAHCFVFDIKADVYRYMFVSFYAGELWEYVSVHRWQCKCQLWIDSVQNKEKRNYKLNEILNPPTKY